MSDPATRQPDDQAARDTERILADWFESEAPPYEPPVLLPAVLARTALTRRRPAWRIPDRWLPASRGWRPSRRSRTPMLALRLTAMGALLALIGGTFALVSSPSPQPPGPRTIIVAPDGTGDATTITEAVTSAHDGDTVLVRPGTYVEQVTITRDITLRGDGGDRSAVVIAPPADGLELPEEIADRCLMGCSGIINGVYGLLVRESDATVEGLTVLAQPDGLGVKVVGGTPVLRDLVIDIDGPTVPSTVSVGRVGLSLDLGATALVTGIRHEGWLAIDRASSPVFEGNELLDTCVVTWAEGTSPVFRDNTVSLCPNGWSFDISLGSSPTIEGNAITGPISVSGGGSATLRGNRIEGGSGIDVAGRDTSAVIDGNEILGLGVGVMVGGSNVSITDNHIHGKRTGIEATFQAGTDVVITGNTITDNGVGLQLRTATADPTLTGNTFCGNEQDLVVPDGSPVSLDGNTVCAPGTSVTP